MPPQTVVGTPSPSDQPHPRPVRPHLQCDVLRAGLARARLRSERPALISRSPHVTRRLSIVTVARQQCYHLCRVLHVADMVQAHLSASRGASGLPSSRIPPEFVTQAPAALPARQSYLLLAHSPFSCRRARHSQPSVLPRDTPPAHSRFTRSRMMVW